MYDEVGDGHRIIDMDKEPELEDKIRIDGKEAWIISIGKTDPKYIKQGDTPYMGNYTFERSKYFK